MPRLWPPVHGSGYDLDDQGIFIAVTAKHGGQLWPPSSSSELGSCCIGQAKVKMPMVMIAKKLELLDGLG